jgi:hypothetical protein
MPALPAPTIRTSLESWCIKNPAIRSPYSTCNLAQIEQISAGSSPAAKVAD